MTKILPTTSDNITDDQLAALRQAARRLRDDAWVGNMAAALECCDRAWLAVAHLATTSDAKEAFVVYQLTAGGAAVLGREHKRPN